MRQKTAPSFVAEEPPYELLVYWIRSWVVVGIYYAHIYKQKRRNMERKACMGVLIGYDADSYKIWCKKSTNLIRSRDISCAEHTRELETLIKFDA